MIKHANTVLMTEKDHQIISSLLSRIPDADIDNYEHLADELDRAEVLKTYEELPKDVVSMHSFVEYVNLERGSSHKVQIVYPHEVDIANGRVSILSAVGSALIGLAEGAEISWPMPDGTLQTLKIRTVIPSTSFY